MSRHKRDIVLLIESENQGKFSRKQYLETKGFSVISENSPQSAIEAIHSNMYPDLILMELDPEDPTPALEEIGRASCRERV